MLCTTSQTVPPAESAVLVVEAMAPTALAATASHMVGEDDELVNDDASDHHPTTV